MNGIDRQVNLQYPRAAWLKSQETIDGVNSEVDTAAVFGVSVSEGLAISALVNEVMEVADIQTEVANEVPVLV